MTATYDCQVFAEKHGVLDRRRCILVTALCLFSESSKVTLGEQCSDLPMIGSESIAHGLEAPRGFLGRGTDVLTVMELF